VRLTTVIREDIICYYCHDCFLLKLRSLGAAIAVCCTDCASSAEELHLTGGLVVQVTSSLRTCESFFCVRIKSRIESAIRFDFESNFRIKSAVYTMQAVTPSNELHRYIFCICHEREWCTQLSTCYSFQFSPKTRQFVPLYDYLTPKLDFKRKFNHRQSFLYKGRLTVRTIQTFWIGSSLRIGSSIWNRIESRSFAGPYSSHSWAHLRWWSLSVASCCYHITCWRCCFAYSATYCRYFFVHADNMCALCVQYVCVSAKKRGRRPVSRKVPDIYWVM